MGSFKDGTQMSSKVNGCRLIGMGMSEEEQVWGKSISFVPTLKGRVL